MRRAVVTAFFIATSALSAMAQTNTDAKGAAAAAPAAANSAAKPPSTDQGAEPKSAIGRWAARFMGGISPKTAPAPAADDAAKDEDSSPEDSDSATQAGDAAKKATVAAKAIFGTLATPAPLAARAIGFYSRGCLAGGKALPIDGEVWQAMRLSRNRNWGHPKLVGLVEKLAEDGAAKDGWPGLLVGDLSQPRGGPMLTGHNSHQVGLDADIWLTPMPYKRLTYKERETLSATSMLAKDQLSVDPKVFTPYHAAIIRRAASYAPVERIFVHPAIKKAMCEENGVDRTSFHKIRPYWGHHYHFHVRITCPPESGNCRAQAPTGHDDGCGKEVDDWIALMKRRMQPRPPVTAEKVRPKKPRPPITLDDLPNECRTVAIAGPAGYADAKAGAQSEAARGNSKR